MDTERSELIGTFDNFEVTIDKINEYRDHRLPHFHIDRIKKVDEYDWEKGFEIATGYYLTHGHGNEMFTDHEFKVINENISAFWQKILKAWNRDHHYKVAETLKCPVLRLRDYSIKALARDFKVILNHADDLIPYKECWEYAGQERLEFQQDQQVIFRVHPWDTYLTVMWTGDLEQNVPHIHIVDFDTCGNLFSAAYTLDTGELFPHGNSTDQLSQEALDYFNANVLNKDCECTAEFFTDQWKCDNATRFSLGKEIPAVIPKFTNTPYSKSYKSINIDYMTDNYSHKELLRWDALELETDNFYVVIWEHDLVPYHPHFHVLDKQTYGEVINAAYRLDTGKLLNHGKRHVLHLSDLVDCTDTCRTILTFDELQEVQKLISTKGEFARLKRWWVDSNSRRVLRKKTRMPILRNY